MEEALTRYTFKHKLSFPESTYINILNRDNEKLEEQVDYIVESWKDIGVEDYACECKVMDVSMEKDMYGTKLVNIDLQTSFTVPDVSTMFMVYKHIQDTFQTECITCSAS